MAPRPSVEHADLQSSSPQSLEGRQVGPETSAGPTHIVERPYQVGDTLPLVCGVEHVARVLDISVSQAHRLAQQGRLKSFELEPLDAKKPRPRRYSGRVLKAWADRALEETHINGRLSQPRGHNFGRKRA